MNLKQKELKDWQSKNFPRERYSVLSKEELIDIIMTLQMTLGICEEAGELAHHVLKGVQGIREGINGIDKAQIADGVGDTLIYGEQLLSALNIDAEKELPKVIDQVLGRNWVDNPSGEFSLKHGFLEGKWALLPDINLPPSEECKDIDAIGLSTFTSGTDDL